MLQQYPYTDSARHGTRVRLGDLSDECLISSKMVRELVGNCSEMHIWRLLNDKKNKALAFPKPININKRNYWRLGVVRQWIREREAQSLRQAPSVNSDRQNCAQNRRRRTAT
jgi:predicted DNA-binding transcriptional regulator AlpA